MIFRSIIEICKSLSLSLQHVKTPLGRWNISNYRETMLKLKYANEDNCGISSHNYKNMTHIQKNNDLDNYKDNYKDKDKEYMYMMGYESAHE